MNYEGLEHAILDYENWDLYASGRGSWFYKGDLSLRVVNTTGDHAELYYSWWTEGISYYQPVTEVYTFYYGSTPVEDVNMVALPDKAILPYLASEESKEDSVAAVRERDYFLALILQPERKEMIDSLLKHAGIRVGV
jgi:hypothetical protein